MFENKIENPFKNKKNYVNQMLPNIFRTVIISDFMRKLLSKIF